jgi:hypothetical protein
VSNRPYYVVSEEYQTYHGDGIDPPEYGCEVYEVFAPNKREAVIAGVKIALSQGRRTMARENRGDDLPPFAGYHAEPAICEHGREHFKLDGERVVYPYDCAACDLPTEDR